MYSLLMNPTTSVNWKNRRFQANYIPRPRSAHSERVITDTLITYVKPDRAVMGTKFRNNPRSMARAKKKIENNYHGAQGFALLPHSLLYGYSTALQLTLA